MNTLPGPARRLSRFWLCILFLAQFALFYQYARREVIGAYPPAFDQTGYLSKVYFLFKDAQHKVFFKSLFHYLKTDKEPGGPMLTLQGVFFQLFFGPGRMSALLMNFSYFCLLEIVVFATARWLAKRDSMGWLAVGLLMLCNSGFFYAGGLFDFRADFIASCLYGIFTCFILRSENLQNRRWLAWAAGSAVLLVSFRSITFIYLGGFFMMLGTGILVLYWMRKGREEERRLLAASLVNVVITGAIWLACSLPMILVNWKAIHDKYVVGHLTGGEKHIRAAEFGVHTLGGHLTYYIKSLAMVHLGSQYLAVSAILVLASLALWLRAERKKSSGGRTTGNLHWISAWAMASMILTPWLVLTADESKSPVVISILDVPVTLVIISLFSRGRRINESGVYLSSRACSVTAACIVVLGIGNWIEQLSREGLVSLNHESVEQINALYDYLMNETEENGIKSPVISCDYIVDWLNYAAVNIHIYESHGRWFDSRAGLGVGMFAETHDEVFQKLGQSDFVLLTDFPKQGFYPFFASMSTMEPEMREWCEAQLLHGREFQIYGGTVTVYVRPGVKLEGISAGWITPEGIRFCLGEDMLSWLRRTSKTRVVFEGGYNTDWLPKPPRPALQLLDASGTLTAPDTASVSFAPLDSRRYRLTIDIKKLLAAQSVKGGSYVVLRLEDSYFVPKQLGINTDIRKLVIEEPTTIRFE